MADSSFPFIPWTIPQRTRLNLQLALGIRPAAWRLAWGLTWPFTYILKETSFSFPKPPLSKKSK